MKLSTRDANAWLARPDPAHAGALIYGQDAERVAEKRRALVVQVIGPEGEAEMRLTRLTGADLRKDGAALDEAMRAQGFFPGARLALVEEATDGLAPVFKAALESWRPGDALVVATAGALAAKSALRKVFEGARSAVAIAIYDDPPGPEEIAAMLRAAGLTEVSPEARAALAAAARELEPLEFRQMVERLGLYMRSETRAVHVDDLAAVAPLAAEADVDSLIAAVTAGAAASIGPLMRRLEAQGQNGVSLSIAALRHFRALHAAACAPGGAAQGIATLRPPVFGPRRDRMVREAQDWGRDRLEGALTQLIELDMGLRSTSPAPVMARVERAMIRLAMLQGSGRRGR